MANPNQTVAIEGWLAEMRAGNDQARKELLGCACDRLTHLTRKMLRNFGRVRRWEQTDDVVQNSLLRLYRTLADVRPANAVEFYRLAALNIRRELLDLAKHYYGPRGLGTNYASTDNPAGDSRAEPAADRPAPPDDPGQLADWAAFHAAAEHLPAEEKEVFDLLWYQELSQAEAAELLNVSDRTIKRRWASARLLLHKALGQNLPDAGN